MRAKFFVSMFIAIVSINGCEINVKNEKPKGEIYNKPPELPKLKHTNDVCKTMVDIEFIKYCLENFDANHNGKLSMFEAITVHVVDCSTAIDFKGIEYFSSLQTFKSESAKAVDLRYNTALEKLDWDNDDICVEEIDLRYNPNLEEFDVPNTKTLLLPEIWKHNFDKLRFNGMDSLTFVSLPKNTPYIAGGAFSGCENLQSIEIPSSVTSIGERAFSGCKNLRSIEIPSSVTSIGESAFFYCTSLESISLPENIVAINKGTFDVCRSLTSIYIPKNVTLICEHAFNGCSKLKVVTFPENLESIGNFAFNYCTSLKTIVLPEKLKSMAADAFFGCELNKVSIRAKTPPTIDPPKWFICYDPDTILYVPRESIDAYRNTDWVLCFPNILAL